MEYQINIEKSYKRMCDPEYTIENVFQPETYECQGDWEGRALLAFCCLYEMTGKKIPCADALVKAIPLKTGGQLFFKHPFDGKTADEMQLGSHNFWLRGLIKYATVFNSDEAARAAEKTFENLYLPVIDFFANYPLERNKNIGEVCGFFTGEENGWRLSSDIGGAYMCVDGLAHYYAFSKDKKAKAATDALIRQFVKSDMVKYGFQTHASLGCMRGMLIMYDVTHDAYYLDLCVELFDIYQKRGMTLTYENFNWFGREDTWTEPCAIVDSLMLAVRLYKITGREEYKTLARRIWFNGMQFCQRESGGAGPNSCVTKETPELYIRMYEAPFCCNMRYPEGLLEYYNNSGLFKWNENAPVFNDDQGRHFIDDKLLVLYNGKQTPIFSCNTVPKDEAEKLRLTVIYDR